MPFTVVQRLEEQDTRGLAASIHGAWILLPALRTYDTIPSSRPERIVQPTQYSVRHQELVAYTAANSKRSGKPERSEMAEIPESYRKSQEVARQARVFLSMPILEGLTPRGLLNAELVEGDGILERRHGVFEVDEVGLSVFDHGALYGDSVFEGLLVTGGRIFTWREHLERMVNSARRLQIDIPYDPVELSYQMLRTVRAAGCTADSVGYIRLVVTRGLGDLGIHPKKCLGSTIYGIVAKIQLYPEELYERGISMSLARQIRRPGPEFLDPTVKSSNYLNNILALLETLAEERPETLMLTKEGFVAEATADNLFLVEKEDGWEDDPSKVHLLTPVGVYCLEGITRSVILDAARDLGYSITLHPQLLPGDLVGPGREVFLTGTGAGLVPVIQIERHGVGDGVPGPVTKILRQKLLAAMADPARGLPIEADREGIERYLEG